MRIYDILLGLITLFLMWKLVHLAVTQETGIKWLDSFTKNISKVAEWIIDTTPIIPVMWSNIKVGAGAFLKEGLLNNKLDSISGDFSRKEIDQARSLSAVFWFDVEQRITKTEKESLSRILSQSDSPAIKLEAYINKLGAIKGKFYFSDVESDLFNIFSDSGGYQQTLKDIYGFQGLSGIKDASAFYSYLNINNNEGVKNWKKLYKVFFDSDNAPSSKEDLVNNKEKYVIQRVS